MGGPAGPGGPGGNPFELGKSKDLETMVSKNQLVIFRVPIC